MAKKICCYCKDVGHRSALPPGASTSGRFRATIGNRRWSTLITNGGLGLHCTFERRAEAWQMQESGYCAVEGVEKKLQPELTSELGEIVAGWAAENLQEFY